MEVPQDPGAASVVIEKIGNWKVHTGKLRNCTLSVHEPLGFASLLTQNASGRQREYAERIRQGGKRLMRTLDLVLTLTRLEANRVEMQLDTVAVVDEVGSVVTLMEPAARAKGLTLRLVVEPGTETVKARLDRNALASILNNLIYNAIKFTERGGITVTVHVDEAGLSPRRVYLSVEDTGIGIRKEFLPHLFEPFTQESTGMGRSYEGTGLGLAIAKRLMEHMGGDIRAESEKGKGSRFTVSFPLIEEQPVPGHAEEEGRGRKPVERHHAAPADVQMLVVEDNEDTALVMQVVLEGFGQVQLTSDAAEALQAVRMAHYDLVLMDINLGGGPNGSDVLRQLKRMPEYEDVPVVAITAYALPGDRERFLQEGFSAYLSKPFMVEDLAALIDELLSD